MRSSKRGLAPPYFTAIEGGARMSVQPDPAGPRVLPGNPAGQADATASPGGQRDRLHTIKAILVATLGR
jgi:hypothetical protein